MRTSETHARRLDDDAPDTVEIADASGDLGFRPIIRLAGGALDAPHAVVLIAEHGRYRLQAGTELAASDLSQKPAFRRALVRTVLALAARDGGEGVRCTAEALAGAMPGARFMACVPLVASDERRLGALCVLAPAPLAVSERARTVLEDLAALAVVQIELRRSEVQRDAMLGFAEATELAMLSAGSDGLIRFANAAATRMFGYSREEMIGQSIEAVMPERSRAVHRAGIAQRAASGAAIPPGRTIEVVARRKDATEFPIELALSSWRDERGLGIGAIIRDISARNARDESLLRLARYDALTGLCNRRHFEDQLRACYERRETATIMLLDLDGFKGVNDSLGHGTGDALLQAIAARLPAILPGDAVLARFGGDEFAALLPGVNDPLVAEGHAAAMLQALAAAFPIGGHTLHLAGSIGYAIAPDHGEAVADLIANTDFALYRAKRSGKNCARLFMPEMRHAANNQRLMKDELFQALQRGELVLHYQPQVCLRSGRAFGAEALLRWRHPTGKLILPGTFLPAIKTSALALSIGAWVLDEVSRQMAVWRCSGLPPLRIGVNLFSAQFRAGAMARAVGDLLSQYGNDPGLMELEITERIALQDDARSIRAVQELREVGVRIAFDDFGTGYASLSWLKRFPLTTLKVDRSFVSDLLVNTTDAAITRAIVAMSNELGLETVAEGIETVEQENVLRALGCRAGQGYRYGKAMPAEDFATLIRETDATLDPHGSDDAGDGSRALARRGANGSE